jgi:hypothetical protein
MWALFTIALLINLFPHGHKMSHVPYLIMSHWTRSSHAPFSLSHTTTTLFSTPFPVQSRHQPPTLHIILTNDTPPTGSPYQPSTPHVNVEPQPNNFSILLNSTHVKSFPPSTLSTPIIAHDQNPTYPIPQHTYNLYLELLASHVGINLPFEG